MQKFTSPIHFFLFFSKKFSQKSIVQFSLIYCSSSGEGEVGVSSKIYSIVIWKMWIFRVFSKSAKFSSFLVQTAIFLKNSHRQLTPLYLLIFLISWKFNFKICTANRDTSDASKIFRGKGKPRPFKGYHVPLACGPEYSSPPDGNEV